VALIPYDPFRQLESMRRDLDRFFSGTLGFGQNLGFPRIDVYESENEVVASCDVPGLEKREDVNIDINNNVLTVSGTINRSREVKEEHMQRAERFIGHFQRSVNLPDRVSPEGTKATYKNGILEVRMPKEKTDTGKKINVEFH